MEKLYYILLISLLRFFEAFADCEITLEIGLESPNNQCPRENYYCDYDNYQKVQASLLTCSNTDISEIYESLENERSRYAFIYIVVKYSSIPTLSPTGYNWAYARKLQIEETKTNEIIPGFFADFDDLRELSITKNKITKITNGEFSSIVKLRVLNLTDNLIETVAPNSFSGLVNLGILDLSKNRITNLPQNIFEYQNYLFYVDISNNLLKNINGTVFNRQSLKTLNISYNYLSDFDFKQFKNLTELEYLRFDHNMLSSLPIDAFYNLNHLKHLDLSFNQINQIPFGLLNDLSELTNLDLSSNNMVLDFHTLSTLKSLKQLKFTNNIVQNFDVNRLSNDFRYLESITLLNDQSWNCNELASAIHKLQFSNISVIRGQNTNESNILGISCGTDSFDERNTSLFPYYGSRENLNENVTNTFFSKFIQILNRYGANTSTSLINIQAYMKKIIDNENTKYKSSDKNFKENVAPWQNISAPMKEISNNTKQILSIISKSLAKDIGMSGIFNRTLIDLSKNMISWQNKSFIEISNSMKRVLSFNSVPVNNNMESKALIGEKHEVIEVSSNSLIFNNILLVMIVCCLTFFAYHNFIKAQIINRNAQEQVQLM